MVQCSMMIALIFTILVGAVAVQPSLRRKDKSCACKNWKQAYQNGIKCGSGKEWAWEATNTRDPPLQYKMFYNDTNKDLVCHRFWSVLNTDRCINLNVGKDEGSWCYVSSSCKTLNGGAKIGNESSWKRCSGKEPKFSDYTPEELYNFAQKNDIWFGGLVKISHPGSKIGEQRIATVDEFNESIPTWVAVKLKEVKATKKPYWFDTNKNGTMPFVIVHDKKAYKVESGSKQDPEHPHTWSKLTCTQGC